jgi:hypothetical protein
VTWLRLLVADLPPRRPEFDAGTVPVGFVVNKWHWDRFCSEYFGYSVSTSFHRCSIAWKSEKKRIMIFLIITGMHDKPLGCGVAGTFTTKAACPPPSLQHH